MKNALATGLFLFITWPAAAMAQAPGPVENLTSPSHSVGAASTNDVISFSWDQPSSGNVAGYSFVLDGNENTVPDAQPENDDPSATSTTTTSLSDGTYYFHIRAVNSFGAGSEIRRLGPFIIDTTGPAPVSSVRATEGDQEVLLQWSTPGTSDFSSVVVRVRTDGSFPTSPVNGALVVEDGATGASSSASFMHTGLRNGTTYRYSFFALDALGNVSDVRTLTAMPEPDFDGDSEGSVEGEGSGNGSDADDGSDASSPDSGEPSTGSGSGGGSSDGGSSSGGDATELSGEVETGRDYTDVNLDAGAVLRGGSVGGDVNGTPGSPALLETRIRDGARLSNVVIAAAAELGEDIEFGTGVVFESIAAMPEGREFADLLTEMPGGGLSGQVPVYDLGQHIVANAAGTLLQGVNALAEIQDFGIPIVQTADGRLALDVPGERFRVRPFSVRRAPAGMPSGLHYDDSGNLVFVDPDGIMVSAAPDVNRVNDFADTLTDLELDLSFAGNGAFRVAGVTAGETIVARPALGARQSTITVPGVHDVRDRSLSGLSVYLHVYEEDGVMFEQPLYASPWEWDAVSDMLLDIDGVSAAALGVDGRITINLDGEAVRLVVDYIVDAGAPVGTSASAARFEALGDISGNGAEDFVIIYADGSRQRVYQLP